MSNPNGIHTTINMVKWEVTSAAVQGVIGLDHTFLVLVFDSASHIFDVLMQDCMLKVLGLLWMYIIKNCRHRFRLGFWISFRFSIGV